MNEKPEVIECLHAIIAEKICVPVHHSYKEGYAKIKAPIEDAKTAVKTLEDLLKDTWKAAKVEDGEAYMVLASTIKSAAISLMLIAADVAAMATIEVAEKD